MTEDSTSIKNYDILLFIGECKLYLISRFYKIELDLKFTS